ncbi:MAG: GspE/PulE family protein [Candidatus Paceibacterota bacterium]|jgi:type IV pilus assembly protein PilB
MADFDEEKQNKKLEELKKQEEEDLLQAISKTKYGLPAIDLAGMGVENEALRVISEKEARELEIAPFKLFGKNIDIIVRSPQKELLDSLKIEIEKKGFNPVFYMGSKASLEKVWERYKELSFATTSRYGGIDISGESILEIADKIKTIQDVEAVISGIQKEEKTHKISKMLEIIMAGAIAVGASDIHIEPQEERIRLRYRLDGILQDIMFFGNDIYRLLNSRIKLISGLKITSEKRAQDGRFSIFIKEDEVSIRTSIIPGAYGESTVMRILDPNQTKGNINELGIEPKLFEIIDKEIKKPHGLILITGPTGSGKTTTLYAFLRKIYSTEKKIITIEDPIEYHLEGITQTQVEDKKGYTFLEGLRSALRQDPDIIMVGEIRDKETAKTSVESALTGHLVFSTIHTNNAAGVIPRLIELDIDPKILVSALSLSIAQRLVRKLCTVCKKEKTPTKEDEDRIRTILKKAVEEGKDLSQFNISPDQPIKLWEAVGCDACNKTGYKGRIGVFEAIVTDESIETIIPENPSEREIKKIAQKQGILDMKEDGIIKTLNGITSLEEVESVVDIEED